MRANFVLSIVLFLLAYPPFAKAQGFGVFPISQSIEVQAGRSAELQFDLLNFSSEEVVLEVLHEYAVATLDEDTAASISNSRLQTLMVARPNDHGSWFEVPTEFTIPANTDGGATTLSIPISLPSEASGTYSGSIVFAEQSTGLLRLSYRCNYNLFVINRPFVKEIIITDVQVSQIEGGTEFSAEVKNIGNAFFEMGGAYTLFRQVGKRGRPVLQGVIDPVTIDPGTNTLIRNSVDQVLATGDYEIRVNPEFDGQRQRPKVSVISYVGPQDAGRYFADGKAFIGPSLSVLPMSAKSRRNEAFFIENLTDASLSVALTLDRTEVNGVSTSIIPDTLTVNAGAVSRFRFQAIATETASFDTPIPLTIAASITQEGGINETQKIEIWLRDATKEAGEDLALQNVQIMEHGDSNDLILTAELSNQGDVAVTPMATLSVYNRLTEPLWAAELGMGQMQPDETHVITQTLTDLSATDRERISFSITNNSLKVGLDVKHPVLSNGQLLEQSITEMGASSN